MTDIAFALPQTETVVDPHAPVMLGIDHQTASIEMRDRIAAAVSDLPSALRHLRSHAREAAIVSTCNRTEIYLAGADLGHAVECLAWATQVDQAVLIESLSARDGADAATHLFSVSAGIESQLLGETQILGQIRDAYYGSRDAGGTGPVLAALFRHALSIGKKARSQTGISRGAASIGSAAIDIVKQQFAPGRPSHAIVVGAGSAVEKVMAHLRPLRIETIDVANRTVAKAEELVTAPGRALALHQLTDSLVSADVVICATSSSTPVITRAAVESAMAVRNGRRLVILDLAVPRDVEPSVGDIPGVALFDVDMVQGHAAASIQRRTDEVQHVRQMVADEVVAFDKFLSARRASTLIVRLRAQAETLRQDEVARVSGRLSERERQAVDQATRAVLRSLLHGPTMALRTGDNAVLGNLLADAFARTRKRDGTS